MEIPRHWRIRKERYSLVGGACPNCDAKMFPVRSVCPNCGHGSHSFEFIGQESQYLQSVAVQSHVVNA